MILTQLFNDLTECQQVTDTKSNYLCYIAVLETNQLSETKTINVR